MAMESKNKRYHTSNQSTFYHHDLKDLENLLDSNNIVISVIENRAREVCVCKMNYKNTSSMEVFLLTDNHSYAETMGVMDDIQPNEILLHDGSRNSVLSKKVEEICRSSENTRIIYISRQYFNQDRGAEMLRKVLFGHGDADLIAKYTVLAGSYCLLRYIENCSGTTLANNSLRLDYRNTISGDRVSIDRRTVMNLELITNLKTGTQKNSLFSVMNFTKTSVGARLLRENILRPITDLPTLNTRLDIVEAFLRHPPSIENIQGILIQLPDLDKMLSGLVSVPKSMSIRTARRGIDTIIYIKQSMKLIHGLEDYLKQLITNISLEENGFQLLSTILNIIIKPELNVIRETIDDIISESTSYTKSQHDMRHQECFAVRSGKCGELDIARKAYLQTVEDIYELADKYSQEYNFPVKVVFNMTRGYHVTIPSSVSPLPKRFIQAVQNTRTISCSTEEMNSLSDRASESIATALSWTHQLIQECLTTIRNHMNVLFNVVDGIGLMDMLLSFAELAHASSELYSRPVLTHSSQNDDIVVLLASRHPVISQSQKKSDVSKMTFIPNDCFLSPIDNLQIITGTNGSGKTVYIKQIALILIMGQMGSFVPAKHATIAVRDRIMSRIGTSDDMEHNLSTFAMEMKEAAYIVANITPRSFIIVDELGRGTSNLDGLSLAFAIAESFCMSKAFTMFVSHYPQLTSIAEMYSNVKNIHLKTTLDTSSNISLLQTPSKPSIEQSNNISIGLKYLHSVTTGPCDMKCGYGIILAEMCAFPTEVIQSARHYQRIIRDQYPLLIENNPVDDRMIHIRNLLHHLLILRNTRLDNTSFRNYLQSIRSKIPIELVQIIKNGLISINRPSIIEINDEHETQLDDGYSNSKNDKVMTNNGNNNNPTIDKHNPVFDENMDVDDDKQLNSLVAVVVVDKNHHGRVVSPTEGTIKNNSHLSSIDDSDTLLDLMKYDLPKDEFESLKSSSSSSLSICREAWKRQSTDEIGQTIISLKWKQPILTLNDETDIFVSTSQSSKKRKSVD